MQMRSYLHIWIYLSWLPHNSARLERTVGARVFSVAAKIETGQGVNMPASTKVVLRESSIVHEKHSTRKREARWRPPRDNSTHAMALRSKAQKRKQKPRSSIECRTFTTWTEGEHYSSLRLHILSWNRPRLSQVDAGPGLAKCSNSHIPAPTGEQKETIAATAPR